MTLFEIKLMGYLFCSMYFTRQRIPAQDLCPKRRLSHRFEDEVAGESYDNLSYLRVMHCIISPAKTFAKKVSTTTTITPPRFAEEAMPIIEQALLMTPEDYAKELKLSGKMLTTARQSWHDFVSASSPEGASLLMYSGMVYKKIDAMSFSPEDWTFAEDRLSICSFVYGLLTPSMGIRPYRMEGGVRLPSGERIFDYWRDRLTAELIRRTKASGGVLLYLASEEMKQLFHWSEVERSVRVIYFDFLTRQPDASLKSIVIYCKMARGAMTRAVIKGRIDTPEALKSLMPEGFVYDERASRDNHWVYVLG